MKTTDKIWLIYINISMVGLVVASFILLRDAIIHNETLGIMAGAGSMATIVSLKWYWKELSDYVKKGDANDN